MKFLDINRIRDTHAITHPTLAEAMGESDWNAVLHQDEEMFATHYDIEHAARRLTRQMLRQKLGHEIRR